MWTGGVRVIVIDDENRILMVKQKHQERTLWTVPGGQIEEGEDSRCAGIREVLEETGLHIEIKGLIWHVEEVGDRGQRFVNFFLAKPEVSFRGEVPKLGTDPEFGPDEQVLDDLTLRTPRVKGSGRNNVVLTRTLKEDGRFRAVYEARTGCTVACHCGPNTIGVMFLNK